MTFGLELRPSYDISFGVRNNGYIVGHSEKTPHNWWKVRCGEQEGWIPSDFVERKRRLKVRHIVSNPTTTTEMFTTISAYTSTEESGLSFGPGQLVQLLEKDNTGKNYGHYI